MIKMKQGFLVKIVLVTAVVFTIISAIWFLVYDTSFDHSLVVGVEDTDRVIEAERGGLAVPESAVGNTLSVVQEDEHGSFRTLDRPESRFQMYLHRAYPSFLSRYDISLSLKPSQYPLSVSIPCGACEEPIVPLSLYIPGIQNYTALQLEDIWAYVPTHIDSTDLNSIPDLVDRAADLDSGVYVAEDASRYIDWDEFALRNKPATTDEYVALESTIFAGQRFYVYLEKDLELSFTKRNRNENLGADSLAIDLRELNGSLVDSKIVADDGVTTASKKIILQEEVVQLAVPESGVYIVDFRARQNDDFGLLELRLNTGSVAFTEGVFLADTSLYTENDDDGFVSIKQKGRIEGTVRSLQSNGDIFDVLRSSFFDVSEKLRVSKNSKGVYIDSTAKYAVSDGWFSFSEDSWFHPYQTPVYSSWKDDERAIVITRAHIYADDDLVRVDTSWDKRDLAPIEQVDVQKPKRLRLDVAVDLVDWSPEQKYVYQYFDRYASVCGIDLMTQLSVNAEIETNPINCDDPVASAYAYVPESYDLYAGEYSLETVVDVDLEAEGVVHDIQEHIFESRGDIEYALLLNDRADIEVQVVDLNRAVGNDSVYIQLVNIDGTVVSSGVVEDDGDILNTKRSKTARTVHFQEDIEPGLYFLRAEAIHDESNIDFVVHSITANTSHIQTMNAKRFIGPSTVYMDVVRDETMSVTVRNVEELDNLVVTNITNDENLVENSTDDAEVYEYYLSPGQYRLSLPDSRVVLSHNVFAASAQALFDVPGIHRGTEMVFIEQKEFPETSIYRINTSLKYDFSFARFISFVLKGWGVFVLVLLKIRWESWWQLFEQKCKPSRISAFRGFLFSTIIILSSLWYISTHEIISQIALTQSQQVILGNVSILLAVLLILISNIFGAIEDNE